MALKSCLESIREMWKSWGFWDRIGYVCLAIAAVNIAVAGSPKLVALAPSVLGSEWWSVTPLLLIGVATVIMIVQSSGLIGTREHHLPAVLTPSPEVTAEPSASETNQASKAIELIPRAWEVDIQSELPSVAVILWAVNFRSVPLVLGPVKTTYFRIANVSPVDAVIDSSDVELAPTSVREVLIRRSLTDAEARVVRDRVHDSCCSAEVRLAGRWTCGVESGDFVDYLNWAVLGFVRGVSSADTTKAS